MPTAQRCDQRRGRYVLYWMQQSQRASFNPALEYAIELGNRDGLPVLVAFSYPDANLRDYCCSLCCNAERWPIDAACSTSIPRAGVPGRRITVAARAGKTPFDFRLLGAGMRPGARCHGPEHAPMGATVSCCARPGLPGAA